MKTYWAWRKPGLPSEDTPTVKKLDYVDLGSHKLCIGVWDNEKYTPLHRAELESYYKRLT